MATKKTKTSTKSSKNMPTTKSRVRKLDRKSRKTVKKTTKVASGYSLLKSSIKHLWLHKRLFGGLFLVYFVLYFVLVKGMAANFQLSDTNGLLESTFGEDISSPEKAATLFGTLLGSAGSVSSESASVFQAILYIIFSLAIIWALRQTFEGKKVGIRQSLYSSTRPLIQYILVYLLLLVQLIPMLIGVGLYGIVVSNGIAVGLFEQLAWLLFMVISILISLYLILTTFMATYIVTLTGMMPMKALKLSKNLIRYRRSLVARRAMFFIFALLVVTTVVFLPLALYLPYIAEIGFLVVSLFILFVFHAYFYSLYRELM